MWFISNDIYWWENIYSSLKKFLFDGSKQIISSAGNSTKPVREVMKIKSEDLWRPTTGCLFARPKSNWEYQPQPHTSAVRPPPGCTSSLSVLFKHQGRIPTKACNPPQTFVSISEIINEEKNIILSIVDPDSSLLPPKSMLHCQEAFSISWSSC